MTKTARRVTGAEAELPDEAAILPLAGSENFPVALRVLGGRTRGHLLSIYGFARLADQLGDAVDGDRLALLDELEADVNRAFDGKPEHPLLRRLAPTVRECGLPRGPFLRLIEANRRDQKVVAYQTFEDLLAYCELSANPVGELVLHVFGAASPDLIELSDRVCTGLQLVEHWQDVGEDFRRGRVYLPAQELDRFGVAHDELGEPHTSERLRSLLVFEVARARALIDEGAPLVGRLHGRARLAVAGYVGGGRANADAIVAAGYDVLAGPPRASGARRLRAVLRTLAVRR